MPFLNFIYPKKRTLTKQNVLPKSRSDNKDVIDKPSLGLF